MGEAATAPHCRGNGRTGGEPPRAAYQRPFSNHRTKGFCSCTRGYVHKAESSIFTQVRTGKIGLADFLHGIGVPEATSPACACGHERETARHTTVFCPEYRATRNQLLIDGGLDFKRLLTEKEGVSKLARWWIRSGRLNQLRLANELIR